MIGLLKQFSRSKLCSPDTVKGRSLSSKVHCVRRYIGVVSDDIVQLESIV